MAPIKFGWNRRFGPLWSHSIAGYRLHDALSPSANALEVVLGKIPGYEKAPHETYPGTAGMKIILNIFGRDASRWKQSQMGQRTQDRPDKLYAARRCGEDFHEIRAGPIGLFHLRWRKATGDAHDAERPRFLHNLRIHDR